MVDTMKTAASSVEWMLQTMKRYNELTVNLLGSAVADGLKAWSGRPCGCTPSGNPRPHGVTSDARIICPPQDDCPPRCLTTITRHAEAGEVIIVPFRVRNTGTYPKTYALGVRPITDRHGNAITQPTLDRVKIEVQPGAAAMAEMRVNIGKGFIPGSLYETNIVIREKAHNQNICFKLYVNALEEAPEAAPYDEKDIDTHFHHWYYHYYCENSRNRLPNLVNVVEKKDPTGAFEQNRGKDL